MSVFLFLRFMQEYRNLCETVTKRVDLIDSEYEYQPPYYHEVYCKGYSLLSEDERIVKQLQQVIIYMSRNLTFFSFQKCAHPAFHCVQRSRILTFVKRSWENECWEPYTIEIPSGCDCMWPVTNLGEISQHY
ncbi:Uncharacterized protein DBV15_02492 [Temnothorax longispinosus]|uniref:Spaetzle domain-containing protein n=1 Tax=Temnothorax longispinosus TaxID=300112 RepID=A0A4S2KX69_9HYME|nr:Uncharacterized protein DBV15_02492 [Temnothorax longispinosus]